MKQEQKKQQAARPAAAAPPENRVEIPATYRNALKGLLHQKQHLAAELEAMERQVALLRQRANGLDGQLDGLLTGVGIALGLDEKARWSVSADLAFLIRQGEV